MKPDRKTLDAISRAIVAAHLGKPTQQARAALEAAEPYIQARCVECLHQAAQACAAIAQEKHATAQSAKTAAALECANAVRALITEASL